MAIRNLPNAKGKIHSTKLNINRGNFRVNVQLTFRQGNWRVESDLNQGTKDILKSMGYNPKRIALY